MELPPFATLCPISAPSPEPQLHYLTTAVVPLLHECQPENYDIGGLNAPEGLGVYPPQNSTYFDPSYPVEPGLELMTSRQLSHHDYAAQNGTIEGVNFSTGPGIELVTSRHSIPHGYATQHEEASTDANFPAAPGRELMTSRQVNPPGCPMTSPMEQDDNVSSTTSSCSMSESDDLYFSGPKTQHSIESVMKKSDVLWNGRGRRTNRSGKIRRRVPNPTQRKQANVRERKRMLNLNDAFDNLRECIPTFAYEKHLSRIDTLRLAMGYIRFMRDILESPSTGEVYEKYANAAHEMKVKWSADV